MFSAHVRSLPAASFVVLATACGPTAAPVVAPPSTAAQTAPIAPSVAARLQSDVNWLADDAREGRRAGTHMGREVGEWLSKELALIGLEAAGERGWTQTFDVPLEPTSGGGAWLELGTLRASEENRELAPLFCAERGEAEGELVFVGYGIEKDELGWNDYTGRDVSGKIALIVRGTPPEPPKTTEAAAPTKSSDPAAPKDSKDKPAALPAGHDTATVSSSSGFASSGSIFTKVMTAKRKGARAVVLVPAKAGEELLRFDAGDGARAGIPCLMATSALGETLAPGYLKSLAKPAANLPSAHVRLFADVVRANGAATNALGLLPGKTHERCIVVGAHYDHLGRGGAGSLAPDKKGEIHNGADDNASGTAVVLEIARATKARGAPECDVLFALWSGEELGLLGSEYWALHPTVPLERVRANLNLDMVGRAGNGKLQVLGAGTAAEFESWMADAGKASGLELVVSTQGSALGGSSDHQSFLKRQIPALHLFSGLHADYHKPSDKADKFEAEGAAKVALLGEALLQRLCAATTLTFVEPKVDQERQKQVAEGGFRAWFGSVPANSAYTGESKGVPIDGTSPGSPAERAGFFKGDVLIQIGDVKIDGIYDMTYALQLYKPGDVVLVRFLRDAKPAEVRVTLSTRGLQ